tara:strand:- start:308 stop:751 length:444 start_codon:yes stop_codon:yes gene_type:complete
MKTLTQPLWTPPKLNNWEDPLIQELYWPDRWKMTVICLCLNMTSGKQVRPILPELFRRWPTPESMAAADTEELKILIKPLGFLNKRSLALKRMSQEWLTKDWTKIKDLYGCGQYAQDSDSIFYLGDTQVEPADGELSRYLEFARAEL